ncbi:DUF3078 domain-containing protein [bacterium]|nr:DUF3078 domain-containing protein [candidate division CSSED10-310 bacterium]
MLNQCFCAIVIVFLLAIPTVSFAEDPEKPEPGYRLGDWLLTGSLTAAGTYTTFMDWQAGGTDTAAGALQTEFAALFAKDRIQWKNTVKIEYGVSKVKDESARKASDLLSLESNFDYRLFPKLAAYSRFKGITAMTAGYLYYADPVNAEFTDGRDPETGEDRIHISDAFDPLQLEQGVGVSYPVFQNEGKTRFLNVRAGLGGRQLVAGYFYTEEDASDPDNIVFSPVDEYADIGLEAGFDLAFFIREGINLTSNAMGFYGFGDEFWKVNWDTVFTLQATKHISLSLTASMLYDELVFDDPQWKTATLLTLSYRLF